QVSRSPSGSLPRYLRRTVAGTSLTRRRPEDRQPGGEATCHRWLGVNVYVVLERPDRCAAQAHVSACYRLREARRGEVTVMTMSTLRQPTHKLLTEPAALDWLEKAAADVPADQAIVELGVYRGDSLVRLALGSRAGNGARVWGIDPWGLPGAYESRPAMRRKYGIDRRSVV